MRKKIEMRTDRYIGEIDITTPAGRLVLGGIKNLFGNALRYRGRGSRKITRADGVKLNYCSDLPVKYAERVAIYRR